MSANTSLQMMSRSSFLSALAARESLRSTSAARRPCTARELTVRRMSHPGGWDPDVSVIGAVRGNAGSAGSVRDSRGLSGHGRGVPALHTPGRGRPWLDRPCADPNGSDKHVMQRKTLQHGALLRVEGQGPEVAFQLGLVRNADHESAAVHAGTVLARWVWEWAPTPMSSRARMACRPCTQCAARGLVL